MWRVRGGDTENVGRETFWKTATWKTKKEKERIEVRVTGYEDGM
jgi:hypothetical protein